MNVGWVADKPWWPGGAELTALDLRMRAVPGVRIEEFSPARTYADDIDLWVIHNCTQFHRPLKAALEAHPAPIVKVIHDMWPTWDTPLGAYLLENSSLFVFMSELHLNEFFRDFRVAKLAAGCDRVVIPPFIDLSRFIYYQGSHQRPYEACYAGLLSRFKGGAHLRRVAEARGIVIHVHGPVAPGEESLLEGNVLDWKGPTVYAGMPDVFSQYRSYIQCSPHIEPFGRSAMEAYLTGCALSLDGRFGCSEYIGREHLLQSSPAVFWETALNLVSSPTN